MPVTSEVRAQVATALLRDLPKEMQKAISRDSKPLAQKLVTAIKSSSGPSPYGAVYAKLRQKARVRQRPGRPPEVTLGGGRAFSGGATISELVWAYEYGSITGDFKRGQSETHRGRSVRVEKRARNRGRYRYYAVTPQFPPWKQQGHWINEIVDQHKDDVLDGWARLVDDMLSDVVARHHG